MTGKVWLVGAGPSDAGLFTLRGREVLEQAEVVVYDALVGPEILAMVPDTAECINAGKRSSHHIMKQDAINLCLLEAAARGKKVVRLKGGDPFLFGRGGEELQFLTEHEIPCEVVPGVSSAIAVPACSGIPVTHRDHVSSVHIITGHRKKGASPELPYAALKECGGTLVFLMGLAALESICRGLLEAGMDPDMPAAVLSRGTTAEQRRLVSTLSRLPREAADAALPAPAILVVGPVCSLAEELAWAEKRELFGCRVVVTRPADRSSRLTSRLRQRGAEVIEIPAIRTVPRKDMSSLRTALAELERYQWIVFTSPAGVKVFMEEMKSCRMDVRSLAGCRIASLGPGTAGELESRGIYPDLMPGIYDGAHLGREVARAAAPGDRILLPRASMGSPELPEEIRRNSRVTLDEVAIYDTEYVKPALPDERTQFEEHPGTMAVFTSASTVRGFLAAVGDMDVSRVRALCIGPQTAAAAEQAGMPVYVAEKATIEALEELVVRVHRGEDPA